MNLPRGYRTPSLWQLVEYTRRPERYLENGRRRFGTPFTGRFPGFGDFVFLTDQDAILEVFRGDPTALHSGESNEFMATSVGPNSLLVLDDEPHARQRRPQVPPLQGERMRAHAAQMIEQTRRHVDGWQPGQHRRSEDDFHEITLQVILRTIFGLEDGPRLERFAVLLRDYTDSIDSPYALMAALVPAWARPLMRWHRMFRIQAAIDRELFALLADRRKAGPEGDDVLSRLMAMRHEDGAELGDRELRDHLFTLLLAGHDTTAVALAWTLDEILRDPDVHARVREELRAVFPDGEVQADGLERLPYLDATIKEALRLRPVLPFVARLLKRPMTVGGVEYPAGVNLCPCMMLVHRDPAVYPEPMRLKPERFLEHAPGPERWFPFGGGARRCLGMWFALYEMRVVLAVLLSRVSLEAVGPPPRVRRRSLLLAPSGGGAVRVRG